MVYVFPPAPRSFAETISGTDIVCHCMGFQCDRMSCTELAFAVAPTNTPLSFSDFKSEVAANPPSMPVARIWTYFKPPDSDKRNGEIQYRPGTLVAYIAFHATLYSNLDKYLSGIHEIEAVRTRNGTVSEVQDAIDNHARFHDHPQWDRMMDMPIIVECGTECCIVPPFLAFESEDYTRTAPLWTMDTWLRKMHDAFHSSASERGRVTLEASESVTRTVSLVRSPYPSMQLDGSAHPLMPHMDMDGRQFRLLGYSVQMAWDGTTNTLTAKFEVPKIDQNIVHPDFARECVATQPLHVHAHVGVLSGGSVTRFDIREKTSSDQWVRAVFARIPEDPTHISMDVIPFTVVPYPVTNQNIVTWPTSNMDRLAYILASNKRGIALLPSALHNPALLGDARTVVAPPSVISGKAEVWKLIHANTDAAIPLEVCDIPDRDNVFHIPVMDPIAIHKRRVTETFVTREVMERTAGRRVLVIVGGKANEIVQCMHKGVSSTHIDGTTGISVTKDGNPCNVVTISDAERLFKSYRCLADNFSAIIARRKAENYPLAYKHKRSRAQMEEEEKESLGTRAGYEFHKSSVAMSHEQAGFLHYERLVEAGIHSSDVLVLAVNDARFVQALSMGKKEAETDGSCHRKAVRAAIAAAANTLSSLRMWAPKGETVPWFAFPAEGLIPHINIKTGSFGPRGVRFVYDL